MLIAFTQLQPHLIVPQFPPVNINVHNKLRARKLVFPVGKVQGVIIPCISWATYLLTIWYKASSKLEVGSACKLDTPSWCPSSVVNSLSGIYARKVPPAGSRWVDSKSCMQSEMENISKFTMYSLVLWLRSIVVMQITQSMGWFVLSSTFLW